MLVMFKCHLDVGYSDTQAAVVRKYFEEYFPHAMQVATAMRQSGADRYVWTTGSWLLYEYLEQAQGDAAPARRAGRGGGRFGLACPAFYLGERGHGSFHDRGRTGIIAVARPAFRPYHDRRARRAMWWANPADWWARWPRRA